VRRYDDKRRAISKRQGGQLPRGDVVALLDVILGTGLRIGEALALRWCDVVQDGDKWLVDVNATMVELVGRGYQRQPVPKTDAGDRLVALPAFSVEGIDSMRLLAGDQAKAEDYVFAARKHSAQTEVRPRSGSNWRRSLRAALADQGLGELGFTPHVARRTVATVVARATGSDEIAGRLLGHQVSRSVTTLHYIERMRRAPDETAVIQEFVELSETLVPLGGRPPVADTEPAGVMGSLG
jgi:integrase